MPEKRSHHQTVGFKHLGDCVNLSIDKRLQTRRITFGLVRVDFGKRTVNACDPALWRHEKASVQRYSSRPKAYWGDYKARKRKGD